MFQKFKVLFARLHDDTHLFKIDSFIFVLFNKFHCIRIAQAFTSWIYWNVQTSHKILWNCSCTYQRTTFTAPRSAQRTRLVQIGQKWFSGTYTYYADGKPNKRKIDRRKFAFVKFDFCFTRDKMGLNGLIIDVAILFFLHMVLWLLTSVARFCSFWFNWFWHSIDMKASKARFLSRI